jgi:hypothetical protein
MLLTTTQGRLINCQVFVDEESLKLDEVVLEPPKRYLSSLTSYFVGGDDSETNFHYIASDTRNKTKAHLYVFGERSINIWTLSTDGADLWKINVQNAFMKNVNNLGEIKRFKIIAQEVIEGAFEIDKILNVVIQIYCQRDRASKDFIVLYYLFRINVNPETKKYIDYMPGQLCEPKSYRVQEDDLNCLVCTNEGEVTYVFMCYETYTLCYNVFSNQIEENQIDVRIIGHGINVEKVRTFMLFADRDILIFSLLREMTFKNLMKFYLKEVEEN